MDVGNLENYTRIIAYDDDNHGVRIFVNGIYIDDMDNRLDAAVRLVAAGQDTTRANQIVTADVYLPDAEGTDEVLDRVHNLLCQAMKLTPEQEIAILNKTYEKLQKRKFDFYLKVQYNNIIEKIKKIFFLKSLDQ